MPKDRQDVGPVTPGRDARVDLYIDSLPPWQQAICREVRALVHAADPAVDETIKRRDRPYFVLRGNVCALLAAKDHVNVFLYDGAIVPDPEGIITSGHDNQTARTVAIGQHQEIHAPALLAMLRAIIANNRAGGWRKLKRDLGSTPTQTATTENTGGSRVAAVDQVDPASPEPNTSPEVAPK